jgi:hypothetical protein
MHKEPIKLKLSFRGNRNYIYAADIAESLFNNAGVCKNIRIEFHNVADHAVKIQEIASEELINFKKRSDVYALMTYKDDINADRYMVALLDASAELPGRIDYDESTHGINAEINEKAVSSNVTSLQQAPLHAIVALNKLLLNQCVEINPWFFVKLELNEWPLKIKEVNLSISSALGHNIYKSNISSSDKLIGNIYFYKRGE